MIKYDVVVCCYNKILVNVVAYVARNYICSHIYQDLIICTTILYFIFLIIHNFRYYNCKLPEDGVLTPKYVGVILI